LSKDFVFFDFFVLSRLRLCGGVARDSSEHRSYCHPDSRNVSAREDVAGHDLASRVDVLRAIAIAQDHPRLIINFHSQVRERDAGAQRISPEGRRVDALGPVGLVGRESIGAAIVKRAMVERAGADTRVE
jgi:hypothetical protein